MNFLLTGDGDLTISNNNLVLVDGREEIAQIIKCNLQTLLGEWFLDSSIGLPWFEEILEKQNSGLNIDSIFIEAIRTSSGVLAVTSYSATLDRATRTLYITFQVSTAEGIIDFAGNVAPGG